MTNLFFRGSDPYQPFEADGRLPGQPEPAAQYGPNPEVVFAFGPTPAPQGPTPRPYAGISDQAQVTALLNRRMGEPSVNPMRAAAVTPAQLLDRNGREVLTSARLASVKERVSRRTSTVALPTPDPITPRPKGPFYEGPTTGDPPPQESPPGEPPPPEPPPMPPVPLPIGPPPEDWPEPEFPTYVPECWCDLFVGHDDSVIAEQDLEVQVGKPFFMRFQVQGDPTQHSWWQVGFNLLGRQPGNGALWFYPGDEKGRQLANAGNHYPDMAFKKEGPAPCDLTVDRWVLPRKAGTYTLWGEWYPLVCDVVITVLDAPPPEDKPKPPAEEMCKCTAFGLVDANIEPCGPIKLKSPNETAECFAFVAVSGPHHRYYDYEFEILDEEGKRSTQVAQFDDGSAYIRGDERCGTPTSKRITSSLQDSSLPERRCTVIGSVNSKECGKEQFTISLDPCTCVLTCADPSRCDLEIVLDKEIDAVAAFEFPFVNPVELRLLLTGNEAILSAEIYSEKGLLEVASDCKVWQMPPPDSDEWSTDYWCPKLSCNKAAYRVWVRPKRDLTLLGLLLAEKEFTLEDTIWVRLSNDEECSLNIVISLKCDAHAAEVLANDRDESGTPPSIEYGGAAIVPFGGSTGSYSIEVNVQAEMGSVFIPPNCCCIYLASPIQVAISVTVNAEYGETWLASRTAKDLDRLIRSEATTMQIQELAADALHESALDLDPTSSGWPACKLLSAQKCETARVNTQLRVEGVLSKRIHKYLASIGPLAKSKAQHPVDPSCHLGIVTYGNEPWKFWETYQTNAFVAAGYCPSHGLEDFVECFRAKLKNDGCRSIKSLTIFGHGGSGLGEAETWGSLTLPDRRFLRESMHPEAIVEMRKCDAGSDPSLLDVGIVTILLGGRPDVNFNAGAYSGKVLPFGQQLPGCRYEAYLTPPRVGLSNGFVYAAKTFNEKYYAAMEEIMSINSPDLDYIRSEQARLLSELLWWWDEQMLAWGNGLLDQERAYFGE